MFSYEKVKAYSLSDWQPADHIADPGEKLDQLAREYSHDYNVSYEVAWDRIIHEPSNEGLVHDYAQFTRGPDQRLAYIPDLLEKPKTNDAGDRLHAATQQVMREFNESDYQTAMDIALEMNPRLRRQYGES